MKPLSFDHGSAASPGSHLALTGISKSFPDRRVLTDVSFTVRSGERLCLIGENGSGKTTLLRIIAGLDDDYLGSVSAPGPVGLYHQQPPFPVRWSVDEVMKDATRRQRDALDAITRTAELLSRDPSSRKAIAAYDDALNEAHRTSAWDIETRADRVLDGLGLADIDHERKGAEMSGGQLARLSLAWLLLSQPTVLLLDEPTNHLDDRGSTLLAELIRSWRGVVLTASHDRALLQDIATGIIDLDPAPTLHAKTPHDDSPGSGIGISSYTGAYVDYLEAKTHERERWEKRYRDEQEELKRLRAAVRDSRTVGHTSWKPRTEVRAARKFYADRNAKTVSRRVRDAERDLQMLEESQVRRPPGELTFRLSGEESAAGETSSTAGQIGEQPSPPNPEMSIIVGTGLAVPGQLEPTDIALGPRSRLLITGENGSGKTTLLTILAGALTAHEGTVQAPRSLTVETLGQEVGTLLSSRVAGEWRHIPVQEAYRRAVGSDAAEQTPLGSHGLIAGRDTARPVGSLSTGQQRRLELAIILTKKPSLLILDEPTNHFSLSLATALEQEIPAYPGAVVIASHDRWLREQWQGERLHLASEPTRSRARG